MYRVHKGHYTSLCMYLCARDVFNIRLAEGKIDEASKIYQALERLVPFIDDPDGRVAKFMAEAQQRISVLSALSAGPKEEKENICGICDICVTEKASRLREMMAALGFASRDKFLKNYLSPALKAGLVEMTEPDSPKSPKQRYRRAKGDM